MPFNSLINGLSQFLTNQQNANLQREINEQNIQFQQQANQQNFDFQREMTQTNFDNQVKMWDMANAYNHPAQQMARYREAGLNPNLIYSQNNTGSTPSVMTAQSASAKAPQLNPFYKNPINVSNVASEFISVLSQLEDLHMRKRENEIQETIQDQITKKYQLINDQLSELISNLRVERGHKSAQTTNILIRNLLDSFDYTQTPLIAQMNNYRLGQMANDYDMIPVFNKIAEHNRDILGHNVTKSEYDAKSAAFNFKQILPAQRNLMHQEYLNLREQKNVLKNNSVLIKNQAKKVANDDKWYWRLSDDIFGMLGDVIEMYAAPKINLANRKGKWNSMQNSTSTFGGSYTYY